MAIVLVQPRVLSSTVVGTSKCAAIFGSNTTTGNTIIVSAQVYGGGNLHTVSSIAINSGTATFSKIIAAPGTVNYSGAEIWAAAGITGGTLPKVTVTFSGTITNVDVVIYEFSGCASTLTQDGTASANTGTNATTFTSPAITTTNAGSVIFIASAPIGGWSLAVTPFTNDFVLGVNGGGVAYAIQTATQTAFTGQFTGTGNTSWNGLICALQPVVTNLFPKPNATSAATALATVRDISEASSDGLASSSSTINTNVATRPFVTAL